MSNVRTLNSKSITPAIVLNTIGEDLSQVKSLYAVSINADGQTTCYATGNLGDLAMAVIALQDLALKHLNGMIESEHDS